MLKVAIAGAGLMGRLIGWQLVKRGADVHRSRGRG